VSLLLYLDDCAYSHNLVDPGIIAIYQDNDPARDMSDGEIVQAIGFLERTMTSSGGQIANAFHQLNQWRLRPN
jgi:hypothetical protein